jgi:hypothetical protein
MNIQELHYSFRLKTDKVDSLNVDSFKDAEIDWILNYTIDVFVKQRYGILNNKQYGFEAIQKRIDDLKTLHKKEYEITPTLYKSDVYEANIGDITKPGSSVKPQDYWFTTRLRADIKKGDCVKNVGVKNIQTDDLNKALGYSFYKPNFNWGRVLATFNETSDDSVENTGSIYLHTDNFEVEKVYIDYIKRPNKVWIGTYVTLDGSLDPLNDQPIQCDLPDHTHEEITTLAASLVLGLISDPNFVQLKQQYIESE